MRLWTFASFRCNADLRCLSTFCCIAHFGARRRKYPETDAENREIERRLSSNLKSLNYSSGSMWSPSEVAESKGKRGEMNLLTSWFIANETKLIIVFYRCCCSLNFHLVSATKYFSLLLLLEDSSRVVNRQLWAKKTTTQMVKDIWSLCDLTEPERSADADESARRLCKVQPTIVELRVESSKN